MSERVEFVQLASRDDAQMSALCRAYGISRKTGYKWLRRYQTDGEAGLIDQSRCPHQSPRRTPVEVETAVLAVRADHPAWGGRKIKAWLERRGLPAPSASTITAILERHGVLREAEAAVQRPWQRFAAAAPNDLWQLDFKGVVHLEQGNAFPLSVLDDHSRFALGLFACPDQQQPTVQTHLTTVFQRYGLPHRILSDNGPPWGAAGQQGLTALEAWSSGSASGSATAVSTTPRPRARWNASMARWLRKCCADHHCGIRSSVRRPLTSGGPVTTWNAHTMRWTWRCHSIAIARVRACCPQNCHRSSTDRMMRCARSRNMGASPIAPATTLLVVALPACRWRCDARLIPGSCRSISVTS